jgi:hypothetical protein
MTRTILMLCGILLMAGCETEGAFINKNVPNTCNSKGFTFVLINYGDGMLSTKAIAKVRPGRELQYRLVPGRDSSLVDYSAALVTITGKAASGPFPVPPADDAWLDASGSFDGTGGEMKVCVPDNPVGSSYYYEITVENVGKLDPRADVEF